MTRCLRPALTAALLLVFTLAACGGSPPSSGPQTRSPAASDPSAPQIALTTPNTPAVLPQDFPTPQRMVGMTGDELQKVLGVPGFRRRDDPAEIWQYRGTACVLDIFLYREKDGIKVSYIDVRGLTVAKVAGEDCVLDVLRATRKGMPTG